MTAARDGVATKWQRSDDHRLANPVPHGTLQDAAFFLRSWLFRSEVALGSAESLERSREHYAGGAGIGRSSK
jgi:hypothetical protein